MNGLSSYSGMTTKVKAMQSKLLTKEEMTELASQHTIADAVAYLKRHPGYRHLFAQANEQELHREDVERILNAAYYENFVRLYSFAGMKQKKYLSLYFKRFEVSLLKSRLRSIFGNNYEKKDISNIRSYFLKFSKIDIDAVMAAGSLQEFVTALEGSPYYRYVSRVQSRGSDEMFDYEIALDLYYFSTIWKEKQKRFQDVDLEMFERSFGFKIDLLNLQWIYRSKKYYDLSPADIFALMIPVHYKLRDEITSQLVNAQDVEEYNNVLKKTYYAKLFPDIRGEILEDIYILLLDNVHSAGRRKAPYSLAILDSYLYEQEYEINKIITVLEGIRYGLETGEILKHIRMKQGGTGQ